MLTLKCVHVKIKHDDGDAVGEMEAAPAQVGIKLWCYSGLQSFNEEPQLCYHCHGNITTRGSLSILSTKLREEERRQPVALAAKSPETDTVQKL